MTKLRATRQAQQEASAVVRAVDYRTLGPCWAFRITLPDETIGRTFGSYREAAAARREWIAHRVAELTK